MKKRLLVGILIGVLWIIGYAWYLFSDQKSDTEKPDTEKSDAKTTTDTLSSSLQNESKKNENNNSAKPLDLDMPPVTEIVGISGNKAPKQANQVAARFHWLIFLSGPTVTSESRQYEVKKITEPDIYKEVEGFLQEESYHVQKWQPIMVSALKHESKGWWIHTVALIDGEQTEMFLLIGKGEDGKWKVQQLPNQLSLEEL